MSEDRAYYYSRAEAEIRMAEKATSPEAVRAHYHLAGRYLDRAYGDGNDGSPTSEHVRSQLPNMQINMRGF